VQLAQETIQALEKSSADVIVSTSTSCVAMLLQDYDHIFEGDPAWQERARKLATRVHTFTEYMANEAALPADALSTGAASPVTYHDACQSHNCLGLKDEARHLLSDVMGTEICEMAESSVCCGFGGTFSVEHPEVSRRILERKLKNAIDSGAGTIIADNPGCIMHIRGALDALGSPIQVKHLAESMDEAIQSRHAAERGETFDASSSVGTLRLRQTKK
jgi:L-lactate dehydrogenase complex protein LldF